MKHTGPNGKWATPARLLPRFVSLHMLLLLALTGVMLSGSPAFCQESTGAIGYIKELRDPAMIIRNGEAIAAQPGNAIFQNDILQTGPAGGLGITFTDDTMISIGPETELTIDSYLFHPEKKQLSFLSRLKQGTMQFISGVIAKLAPEKVAIETPLGTIGVRGTRFLVKIDKK